MYFKETFEIWLYMQPSFIEVSIQMNDTIGLMYLPEKLNLVNM